LIYNIDIMRTLVDLTEAQVVALGDFCARQKISRAEAIRRAVEEMLAQQKHRQREAVFGSWASRGDSRVAVDALRGEWE
jgi:metal-responsive CopG/Arc/MetJ family transcriptional regulator